jgi:hypothetical protein
VAPERAGEALSNFLDLSVRSGRSRQPAATAKLLPISPFVLQREVFKHFDEDSRPREDKIIHNEVAKAAKTNHCRSLVETVLSSWPLCACCEISGYLVAALPQCELSVSVVNRICTEAPWASRRSALLNDRIYGSDLRSDSRSNSTILVRR